MKIALLTDTHFSVRNDNPVFLENQLAFYNDTFFPYLKEHDITEVIHLGDFFDRRKYINFNTLDQVKKHVLDRMEDEFIQMHVFPGNHDAYFRNTNRVNSIDQLLRSYENITVVDDVREVFYDDFTVLMCPWINQENSEKTLAACRLTKATVMMGHLEIAGFVMHKNTIECIHGFKRELFDNFKMVMSGHFHEPSTDGHIWYLGAPSEYTWSDFDCRRGFNIFDTETLGIDHVQNPNRMYYQFTFDKGFKPEKDLSYLKHKIIRVIVGEGVNNKQVEKFVNSINDVDPHKLEVIDNTAYHIEQGGECLDQEAIENEDTVSIVESYVDSIEDEITLDAGRLKELFKTLYVEALAIE